MGENKEKMGILSMIIHHILAQVGDKSVSTLIIEYDLNSMWFYL